MAVLVTNQVVQGNLDGATVMFSAPHLSVRAGTAGAVWRGRRLDCDGVLKHWQLASSGHCMHR